MKSFKFSYLVLSFSLLASAGDLPAGFEKAGFIEQLKTGGKAVTEIPINAPTELIQISRAYYVGVKDETYVALVTDHPKYSLMFSDGSPRIRNALTLSSNKEKNQFEYALHIEVDGPFGAVYEVNPTGKQIISSSTAPQPEIKIVNDLTNYKAEFSLASQTTRIIPFAGGILVEDRVHIVLKKQTQTSAAMKKQLGILFGRFLETFRKELK